MSDELSISNQPLTMTALSNMLNGSALPARYEYVGDAVATIMVGKELGLPPMASLNEMFLVNGSVGLSGKAMVSLVFRAGHAIYTTLDPKVGTAVAWRRDPVTGILSEVGTYIFTMEDAEAAGLAGTGTYKKYPADMLGWKAVARAVRFAFPDVIMGYLPSEIGIEAPDEAPLEEEMRQYDLGLEAGNAQAKYHDMLDAEEVVDDILDAEQVADALDGKVTDE